MMRHALTLLAAFAVAGMIRTAGAVEVDDPARIAELAEAAATGEWQARSAAIDSLREEHGPYAVNGFLRWIGSRADLENRVQAIYALRRLGSESVLALVAALHAEDPMIRRNVALVLAEAGDERAVPALAAVQQHDPDALAQEQAAEALARLGYGGGDAVDLLIDLARRFRTGEALRETEGRSAVFFWNGRRVGSREVNEGLYGPAYAKVFAEDALRIDPMNTAAQEELVAAYGAMLEAIEADGGDWSEATGRIHDLLALGGAPVEEEMAPPEFSGSEVGSHYDVRSPAKRERYEAALYAVATDPTREVVRVLGDALSESVVRHVLVVDEDRGDLNELVAVLNTGSVVATGASSGAMGLLRAKTAPVKDAIVIRSSVRDIPVDRFVGNLRRDSRTQDVPVIVVADEAEVDRVGELLGDAVVAVVPAPVSREVIAPSLEAAFESATLNDERMQAGEFSRRAAESLAALEPSALSPATDAMVGAIGREDPVQIPVLHALGRLGTAEAQVPAAQVFADPAATTEARVAAADALAGVLAHHTLLPKTEAALRAALNGEDAALRSAAARALGAAKSITAEERSRLLLEHAVTY